MALRHCGSQHRLGGSMIRVAPAVVCRGYPHWRRVLTFGAGIALLTSACGEGRAGVFIDSAITGSSVPSARPLGSAATPNGPKRGVSLDFSRIDSLSSLASSTEYMVRGTVLDGPASYQIGPMEVNHYAAVHLKVKKVVASRPDVKKRISAGDTLLVGFNVLDPAQRAAVSNFDSLAQEGFPTQDQVPAKGTDVIGFLVATQFGDGPTGYESVGYADADKNPTALRALPGSLEGRAVPLSSITASTITRLYDSPAPWRLPPSSAAQRDLQSASAGGR
jgi:hypothetical protein